MAVRPGTLVPKGATVLLIDDLHRMAVRLRLAINQGSRVHVDQAALVRMPDAASHVLCGRVAQVVRESPDGHQLTDGQGGFDVLVEFHGHGPQLWPAMRAQVQIHVDPDTDTGDAGAVTPQLTQATTGPLVGTVTQRVEVDHVPGTAIRSPVSQESLVRSIADHGQHVAAGETIAELDGRTLEQTRQQQAKRLAQEEAAFQQAKRALADRQIEKQNDVVAAQQALDLARLELQEYQTGTYEQARESLKSQIAQLRAGLDTRQRCVAWSERVVKKRYITETQLADDRLALEQQQVELQQAEERLECLEETTRRLRLAQLEANVNQAEHALAGCQQIAATQQVHADSILAARQRVIDLQQDALRQVDQEIAACTIRAPHDGTVVHTPRDAPGEITPIRRGAKVYQHQMFLVLARSESPRADIRLKRAPVAQMLGEIAADIQVHRIPTVRTAGSRIGVVDSRPDLADVRTDALRIAFEVQPQFLPWLLQGRTVIVQLRVHRAAVLRVPAQAVLHDGERSYCFVNTAQGFKKRYVVPGLEGDSQTEIKQGIDEGVQVVVDPYLLVAHESAH
jgi:HlyD family secretion protein